MQQQVQGEQGEVELGIYELEATSSFPGFFHQSGPLTEGGKKRTISNLILNKKRHINKIKATYSDIHTEGVHRSQQSRDGLQQAADLAAKGDLGTLRTLNKKGNSKRMYTSF